VDRKVFDVVLVATTAEALVELLAAWWSDSNKIVYTYHLSGWITA